MSSLPIIFNKTGQADEQQKKGFFFNQGSITKPPQTNTGTFNSTNLPNQQASQNSTGLFGMNSSSSGLFGAGSFSFNATATGSSAGLGKIQGTSLTSEPAKGFMTPATGGFNGFAVNPSDASKTGATGGLFNTTTQSKLMTDGKALSFGQFPSDAAAKTQAAKTPTSFFNSSAQPTDQPKTAEMSGPKLAGDKSNPMGGLFNNSANPDPNKSGSFNFQAGSGSFFGTSTQPSKQTVHASITSGTSGATGASNSMVGLGALSATGGLFSNGPGSSQATGGFGVPSSGLLFGSKQTTVDTKTPSQQITGGLFSIKPAETAKTQLKPLMGGTLQSGLQPDKKATGGLFQQPEAKSTGTSLFSNQAKATGSSLFSNQAKAEGSGFSLSGTGQNKTGGFLFQNKGSQSGQGLFANAQTKPQEKKQAPKSQSTIFGNAPKTQQKSSLFSNPKTVQQKKGGSLTLGTPGLLNPAVSPVGLTAGPTAPQASQNLSRLTSTTRRSLSFKKIYAELISNISKNKFYQLEELMKNNQHKLLQGVNYFRYNEARQKENQARPLDKLSIQALSNRRLEQLPPDIHFFLNELVSFLKSFLEVDIGLAKQLLQIYMQKSKYVGRLVDEHNKVNQSHFREQQLIQIVNGKPAVNQDSIQIGLIREFVLNTFISQHQYYLKVMTTLIREFNSQNKGAVEGILRRLIGKGLESKVWQSYVKLKTNIPSKLKAKEIEYWIYNVYDSQISLLYLLEKLHSEIKVNVPNQRILQYFRHIDEQQFKGTVDHFKLPHKNIELVIEMAQNLLLSVLRLEDDSVLNIQAVMNAIRSMKSDFSQPFKRLYHKDNYASSGKLYTSMRGDNWGPWINALLRKCSFSRQGREQEITWQLQQLAQLQLKIIKRQGISYLQENKQNFNQIFQQLVHHEKYQFCFSFAIATLRDSDDGASVNHIFDLFLNFPYYSRNTGFQKINAWHHFVFKPLSRNLRQFLYDDQTIYREEGISLDYLHSLRVQFILKIIRTSPEDIFRLESLMLSDRPKESSQLTGSLVIIMVLDILYQLSQSTDFRLISKAVKTLNALLSCPSTLSRTALLIAKYDQLIKDHAAIKFQDVTLHPLCSIVWQLKRSQFDPDPMRMKAHRAMLQLLQILVVHPYCLRILPLQNQRSMIIDKQRQFLQRYDQFSYFFMGLQNWEKAHEQSGSKFFVSLLKVLTIKLLQQSPVFWRIVRIMLERMRTSKLQTRDSERANPLLRLYTVTLNQIKLQQTLFKSLEVIVVGDGDGDDLSQSLNHSNPFMIENQQFYCTEKTSAGYLDKHEKTMLKAHSALIECMGSLEAGVALAAVQTQSSSQLNLIDFLRRVLTKKESLFHFSCRKYNVKTQQQVEIKTNIVLALVSYLNFQSYKQIPEHQSNPTRPKGFVFRTQKEYRFAQTLYHQMTELMEEGDFQHFRTHLSCNTFLSYKYSETVTARALRLVARIVSLWDSSPSPPKLGDMLSLRMSDSKSQMSSFVCSNSQILKYLSQQLITILINAENQTQDAEALIDLILSCFKSQKGFLNKLFRMCCNRLNPAQNLQNVLKDFMKDQCYSRQLLCKWVNLVQQIFAHEQFFKEIVQKLRDKDILTTLIQQVNRYTSTNQTNLENPTAYDDLSSVSLLLKSLSEKQFNEHILELLTVKSLFQLALAQLTSKKNPKSIDLLFQYFYCQEWARHIMQGALQVSDQGPFHLQQNLLPGLCLQQSLQRQSQFLQFELDKDEGLPGIMLSIETCNNKLGKDFYLNSSQVFHLLVYRESYQRAVRLSLHCQHNSLLTSLANARTSLLRVWSKLLVFVLSLGEQGHLMSTTKSARTLKIDMQEQVFREVLPCRNKMLNGMSQIISQKNLIEMNQSLLGLAKIATDILRQCQKESKQRAKDTPNLVLGMLLNALNFNNLRQNKEVQDFLKFIRNDQHLYQTTDPVSCFTLLQLAQLTISVQAPIPFADRLMLDIQKGIPTQKIVLGILTIVSTHKSFKATPEFLGWLFRILDQPVKDSQFCSNFFLMSKFLLSLLNHHPTQLLKADLVPALASNSLLRSIFNQECYSLSQQENYMSTSRSQVHLVWVWTLNLVYQFMGKNSQEGTAIHSGALFLKNFIDRFILVLEATKASDLAKDGRRIQPSLAFLEQLTLMVSILWILSINKYIWKAVCPKQNQLLSGMFFKHVLSMFSAHLNPAQVFIPQSNSERVEHDIHVGDQQPTYITSSFHSPIMSPYRSPSSSDVREYHQINLNPSIFVFHTYLQLLRLARNSLACALASLTSQKLTDIQSFRDISKKILEIQGFLTQLQQIWERSESLVCKQLDILHTLNRTVENSISSGFFNSVSTFPKTFKELISECWTAIILSVQTTIILSRNCLSSRHLPSILVDQIVGELKKKQQGLIGSLSRPSGRQEGQGAWGSHLSYLKQLQKQVQSLQSTM